MDKLRAIKLFVRLTELQSFTKVADELNVSKSMVSKELSRLEHDLGTRLLQRSTRKLQLTEVGKGYVKHCRKILLEVEDAESYVQDYQSLPKGQLKINTPMILGVHYFSKLFSDFLKSYPDIELDVHLSDESIDLIEHGFDLGFRAASKPFDSQYIGKKLTTFSYKVCTSELYLQSSPPLNDIKDLVSHNCFVYSYFRDKNYWPLGQGVQVDGNLKVNNTLFLLEALKKGLGIGFLPDFVCDQALKNKEIIEIFKDVEKTDLTLYAVYPARDHIPPKLRHCVDFVSQWFKKQAHQN